jgi:hypothetical protein
MVGWWDVEGGRFAARVTATAPEAVARVPRSGGGAGEEEGHRQQSLGLRYRRLSVAGGPAGQLNHPVASRRTANAMKI